MSKAFQFCNTGGCTSAPLKFAIAGRLFWRKAKYKGTSGISSFTKVLSIAALLVCTSVVLERYQTCQKQSQCLLVCLVSLAFDFCLKVETDVAPFHVGWLWWCCGGDRTQCHLCQQETRNTGRDSAALLAWRFTGNKVNCCCVYSTPWKFSFPTQMYFKAALLVKIAISPRMPCGSP